MCVWHQYLGIKISVKYSYKLQYLEQYLNIVVEVSVTTLIGSGSSQTAAVKHCRKRLEGIIPLLTVQ